LPIVRAPICQPVSWSLGSRSPESSPASSGGIIVGAANGPALGFSAPAAGLAVIVLTAIDTLGSWEAFLLAGVSAGVLQIALGFARAGVHFPSSVIKGMLSGIGLTIILEQLPHAVGGRLPITQVIVRSSANIRSGARSKLSAILHGVLLLLAVLALPNVLNLIPLAPPAAILLLAGIGLGMAVAGSRS